MQKRRPMASTKWLKVMLSMLIGLEVVLGVFASPKTVKANLPDAQYLGEIRLFPYRDGPEGWIYCAGQVLTISLENSALYTLLGNNFGGDGTKTFALPDLRGEEPVPGMGYYIAAEGLYPRDSGLTSNTMLGELRLFPYYMEMNDNWVTTDGRALNDSEPLYSVYGTTFGQDRQGSFKLPQIDSVQSNIRYFAAKAGIHPGRAGEVYVGETRMFPLEIPGLASYMADGKLLNVAANRALYELIGNKFGGTPNQTFGVPDLRGNPLTQYYVSHYGYVPTLQQVQPVSVSDQYTTAVSTPLTVSSPGVMSNDSHVLTAKILNLPAHGKITFHKDGSFTYTPDVDFVGTDSFTYIASNHNKSSAPAIVSINVTESEPKISGVTDGGLYNHEVTPVYTHGTGMLNGQPFASGTTIRKDGQYKLVVESPRGKTVKADFEIDRTAPLVTGVADGGQYDRELQIFFNEGSATLNQQAFQSGERVNTEGVFDLVVTDRAGNQTQVHFSIYFPKTVTFDSNGGSPVVDAVVPYATVVTQPVDPVKPGYVFGGWYMDRFFQLPFDFKTLILDNLTLYAKWIDSDAPVVVDRAPLHLADDVPIETKLEFTFDEPVIAGSGKYISIMRAADHQKIESIDVTDSSRVSVIDEKVAVSLTRQLSYLTRYYVEIEEGAFQDAAGNLYAGMKGPGDWSFTTEAGPVAAPLAPANLTATAGDGEVTLQWSTVTDATYYDIYSGTKSGVYGSSPIATVTGSTYSAGNLLNGTTYYFAVKAGNDGGSSAFSEEVSARPAGAEISVPGDADLSGLALSHGTLAPAFNPAVTSYISHVGNRITEIRITPSVSDPQATVTINGKAESGGQASDPISLAVGSNSIHLVVTAQNGTTKTYAVDVTREAAASPEPEPGNPSNPGTPGGGSGSSEGQGPGVDGSSQAGQGAGSGQSPSSSSHVKSYINDVLQTGLISSEITKENGQTVLTVKMNGDRLQSLLTQEKNSRPIVRLRATEELDQAVVVLEGRSAKALEASGAMIAFETLAGSVRIPVQAISEQIGSLAGTKEGTIRLGLADGSAAIRAKLKQVGNGKYFGEHYGSIDVSVAAYVQGKRLSGNTYSSYVELEVPVEEGSAAIVKTAVLLDDQGKVHHAPTRLVTREGRTYAIIKGLYNGTYALISHDEELSDMKGHWAEAAVNEMASRLVVSGRSVAGFHPNEPVTRAEFVTMMVRSLGLTEQGNTSSFQDVTSRDWYVGAVSAASGSGLIHGYADGTFLPNGLISRQEAMVIFARALKFAEGSPIGEAMDSEAVLDAFQDRAELASWAKGAAAEVVHSGLMSGYDARLRPRSDMTRAETATILLRMLSASGMIGDMPSK
ncbi:Listeria/Bacterioides repeat-containing protein [Paenibacillus sp. cl141a]|uniref:tail fiber protein n=1 Tax=Paenibacillus sp. cl141a TaxID=1761877 RepID=UPI0008C57C08|nr:tail fiber protein [Paenibacillus sp. cl141a]SEL75534.1 Listeria/Bacterioides repeat-containing protein [Paenibacillus sp. cl141a]